MSDAPSYAPPVAIGEVMVGSTVSRIEISHHPDFAIGDWVLSQNGWQKYDLSDGKGIFKLDAQLEHPSYALGVLGMPGFTAYMGLLTQVKCDFMGFLSWVCIGCCCRKRESSSYLFSNLRIETTAWNYATSYGRAVSWLKKLVGIACGGG
jgi:hypothetical protein